MPASTWLILPTYEEVGNLAEIVARAREALQTVAPDDHAILIVDDASPDGTGAVADRLAGESDTVRVLHRPGKGGLGTAYVAGFAAALAHGAEILLEMDADFSHDPADLVRLVTLARTGADLVIGSRYVPGGRIESWGLGRRIVSRAGGLYARAVLRVPVHDLTSGFKCVRADALRAIDYGSMRANGYAFQIELTHRVLREGLRVSEVPIVFHERREGRSTMSSSVAWEAIWRVPQLRAGRRGAATDVDRSARLLFSPELAEGRVDASALDHPAVRAAVASREVPPAPVRLLDRVRLKRGAVTVQSAVIEPLVAARQAVLGADADRPPRFLVRMDEYPHYASLDDPERYGDERFARWRDIMARAGCAHLIAVLPVVPRRALDPDATGARELADVEVRRLAQLKADGVALALHGYDHRTRDARPRRHSELSGLDPGELQARLDRGEAVLERRAALHPRIFVAPFNRFDAGQYGALADRYDVVCGGPESVRLLGFHRTPLWRGDAVYLPTYAPLYGTAAEVLPAAMALIEAAVGLWVPIALHWGWEADRGWSDLEELARAIAPYAADWQDFLAAVDASR